MIKDKESWQVWEDELIRSEPADYAENLKIFEAMCEHARRLGVFFPERPTGRH